MGAVQRTGRIGAGYDDHVALAVKLRLGDRYAGGSTPSGDRNDALNVGSGNSEASVSELAAQLEMRTRQLCWPVGPNKPAIRTSDRCEF